MNQIVKSLLKLDNLLCSPDKWTHYGSAVNKAGRSVSPFSGGAVKWDLWGAIDRSVIYRHQNTVKELLIIAARELDPRFFKHLKGKIPTLVHWHDYPPRTFDEVKAVIKRARELA